MEANLGGRLQVAGLCLLVLALIACERAGPGLGKQIYLDGIGLDGRVSYTQGPDWLRFAVSGCAVCHGDRGQGLTVRAGGVTGVAPAIDRAALRARGYDDSSLRTALIDGVDPHGREFHYYMPRWELGEEELDALVAYLQAL
jgi:mono/diheme cytochrome c family protein